ncbi:hypothetical protein [Lewinella cohaerens]|uniref:hypothetical protein n=1 Tax=Lewinella cohaerens TaxID=70995 RepID=UPI0003758E11|nr:hypothetical protein [Lewinella cohaerens]
MNSRRLTFKITYLSVFIFLTSQALQAQTNKTSTAISEVRLTIISGRSSALEFDRNYSTLQSNKADVVSDGAYLFALRANYTQSFYPRLAWSLGLEAGLDSYHLRVTASEEFLNVGLTRPYNQEATFFDLAYAAVVMGLKYQLPITSRSSVSVKANTRFSFFMPVFIGVGFGVSTGTGIGMQARVFDADMKSNPDDQLIVSPEFGLDYTYDFPQSNFALVAGIHTSFSRKVTLSGDYLLTGEQEVFRGTLQKKMMFFNLGIGVAYCFR